MPEIQRICDILLQWEEAKAEGKSLSIEELCCEQPELAPAVRYRIEKLEAVDRLLDGMPEPSTALTLAGPPLLNVDGELQVPEVQPWEPPGYQILGQLGRGGMGVVYKARQIGLDRVVALKTIPASTVAGPSALARFDIEGRVVARLQHPHIVQIYEIGNHAGCPYFSLEYMDGGNLARWLDRKPIDVHVAAGVAEVLARAVHYAHTRGIIHRDLKPQNILMSQGEGGPDLATVKLSDFGLARLLAEEGGSNLTKPGTTLGTPSYMAPEQAQGRISDIGPATDVYGLGAVLYEMLCGQPPFHADSDWMTVHHVITTTPEPVHSTRPDCPKPLEAICLRCLAKDPAARFPSAEALADDLRRFLDGQPIETPMRATLTGDSTRRAWLAATAVAALGSLGAAAALRMARGRAPIDAGVLQSQTEFMGDSGQAVINATLFAIEEINRAGGLLGRAVRPRVGDGESDELVFASEARRLLGDDGVHVLFGCLTSSHRRAVEPIVRAHNRLLVYPGESEGLELSPHVVCLGPLVNQHVLPAVGWFRRELGKRRFFFAGSDTIYARAARAILGDAAGSLGVEIVGDSFVNPVDVVGWAVRAVHQIKEITPDAVVTLIQGKANLAFIHRLRSPKGGPKEVPTLSCTFTEQDLRNILRQMAGEYLCGHYYQSLNTRQNKQFLARLARDPRFGADAVVSDAMVAAYMGVHVWAAAVRRAGTFEDLPAIRRAMAALTPLPGPGGPVRLDPGTQCDAKYARVARVGADRSINILWSSERPETPVVYPATRSRERWDALIASLQAGWGGHWSARAAIAGARGELQPL
jgi:urea transport system substrate-binding protein